MKKDDGTFSIVSYNSAVSAFTGVRTEDIGKLDWSKGYCTDIIEEDAPKMKAALDRLCKIGDTSHIDYKIDRGRGKMDSAQLYEHRRCPQRSRIDHPAHRFRYHRAHQT